MEENINIELYLKANASGKFSYTGIYLGSKEDEEKTPVIEGTINEDNNQVYEIQHSAEQKQEQNYSLYRSKQTEHSSAEQTCI